MKVKRFLIMILTLFVLVPMATISICAEESTTNANTNTSATEPTASTTPPIINQYYWSETQKTGLDNGYSGKKSLASGDPHFGWKLGDFRLDGFSAKAEDEEGNPVFLKNNGDKVVLWFSLQQDIHKLNGKSHLKICEDKNGYDRHFGVPKTNFKHGVLIIRKTDASHNTGEPVIFTDYLEATASKDADTQVEVCEEGDYEVTLDYEIKDYSQKVLGLFDSPQYSNYCMYFRFSVRNGNCMAFLIDTKTGGELSDSSFTPNGFRVDFSNSQYLDAYIKKEVLVEGAVGLSEDTRYNRPVKDGDTFKEEGIYTLTFSNKYTSQKTTKKIYIGTDNILKAVAVTGKTVEEVKACLKNGDTIQNDGTITAALPNAKSSKSTPDTASINKKSVPWLLIPFVVVCVVIITAVVHKKRKKKVKFVNIEPVTEDQEV